MQALSLRGLLRIWCALHLPSVLYFLTLWGFVNHGFLDNIPRPLPFPQSDKKVHPVWIGVAMVTMSTPSNQIRVLVIGAGSAGIAAANHLRNYGHSVSATRTWKYILTPPPPNLIVSRYKFWRQGGNLGVVSKMIFPWAPVWGWEPCL